MAQVLEYLFGAFQFANSLSPRSVQNIALENRIGSPETALTAKNEYAPGGVVASELLGLQKCKMTARSPKAYALSERFPNRPGGAMRNKGQVSLKK